MAFAVRTDSPKSNNVGLSFSNSSGGYKGQKRDRPYCTNCKFLGHTVDKCYKLHGYPTGYKSKSKDSPHAVHPTTVMSQSPVPPPAVHQAAVHQLSTAAVNQDQFASFGGFVQTLTSNQYQQLLSLFSQHLTGSAASSAAAHGTSSAGFSYPEDDWQG
ncbi:hypothetical protein ACOSQ4_006772 [Xanthoceras sorbifolium]